MHGESDDSSARYVQDVPRSPLKDSIIQNKKNASGNSEQKNSLGEDIAPIGNYNVRGKDITLGPVRKDIAPVQQSQTQKGLGPVRADIVQKDVPNPEGNAPAEQTYSPDG